MAFSKVWHPLIVLLVTCRVDLQLHWQVVSAISALSSVAVAIYFCRIRGCGGDVDRWAQR